MLCSSTLLLTCEQQVSSVLQVVLAPWNVPCLCSHRGRWHQGICQWGKQGKPQALGNSRAGCQDGSKHSARGHWQKKIFCKEQNCFCYLWIVSSNLSVPVFSSAGSAMEDSSDISPIPSLSCSSALPSKFLCRTTQCYERIPQPTSLLPVLQQRCLAPCIPLWQICQVKGKAGNGSWCPQVAEEQHPNLTLWYCLLNSILWTCCNKLVEILLVWNETLHLKWLLMHS